MWLKENDNMTDTLFTQSHAHTELHILPTSIMAIEIINDTEISTARASSSCG